MKVLVTPIIDMEAKYINLDHGSGGLATRELVEGLFVKRLENPLLSPLEDSAVLQIEGSRIAFTTDSYVVDPIFFPGGDIGSLSVHGTINDLSMKGARPLALSLSFVIEEGLSLADLENVISSIEETSKKAGVPVVTGDTKVVPKGKGDKIFINTSGIGLIPNDTDLGFHRIIPGDAIIVSGTVGDHGVTILNQREGFGFSGDLKSDSMPLHKLVEDLVKGLGEDLHCLRDPTRGGLATILWEVSNRISLEMEIDEEAIPISKEVQGIAEILGLDPLYLANEGKLIAWVSNQAKELALKIINERREGKKASIIGRVNNKNSKKVVLNTKAGGRRLLHALTGSPLPRIC